jgi:hypothetical protein
MMMLPLHAPNYLPVVSRSKKQKKQVSLKNFLPTTALTEGEATAERGCE